MTEAVRRPWDEIVTPEDIRATEDVKAALWLLAWSEQEQATQRRVVCEALGHLAHTGV